VASLVQVDDPAGGGAPGNALFLPTRWITSYDQRIGVCGDPNAPCDHEDNACPAEKPMLPGMCNGSPSLCTRKQWCNPGTCQGVLADPFLSPETSANAETLIELTNPRRLYVTLTAQIAFPELYSADAGEHGTMHLEDGRHARVRWDLDTILTRAGLSEEDAQANGSALALDLRWDCGVKILSKCVPVLKVRQLSPGTPFLKSWATYHRRKPRSDGLDTPCHIEDAAGSEDTGEASVEFRDLTQARGLWLVVSTSGTAKRIDVLQIVSQVFIALALIPIATFLADFIMQHVFSERRHYREYKTEESPDFSDVRAKVEQLAKLSQSRQAKEMEYA